MAYLGRKGASAALTSADIPDGSISAVKVAADVATQAEIDLKANLASPTLVTPTIANMANCTFPVGHIIQTTDDFHAHTWTACGAGGNSTFIDTVVTGSITTTGATNAVIVHFDCAIYENNTSSDARFGLRFKKVHSGGTSYPQTIAQQDLTESGTSGSGYSGSTTNYLDRWSGSYIDESCGVAGAITYTLQCAEYDQSNHLNVGSGNMNGEWHIWFQEVKR